jgi:hypothetical protein
MYQLSLRHVATALLLASLSVVVVSEAHAAARRPTVAVVAARTHEYPWCLHNYGEDYIDCSFRTRSQCEGTAAGGIGQCDLIAPGAQPGG